MLKHYTYLRKEDNMLTIAIDGACRRNGKPDCVSAGGVYIMHLNEQQEITQATIKSNYELHSTNQRGELLALLTSLDYVYESQQSAQIITDSEYLFNTMTKDWCSNWIRKGWITASGSPVKNKDIWVEVTNAHRRCLEAGYEIMFYHIKGHVISFGEVTSRILLKQDQSGVMLYKSVLEKIHKIGIRQDVLEQVVDLSIKNNGFELPTDILNRFVAANIVADELATHCVDAADALLN